jgi:sugar lactone lactonase YvrE
MWHCGILRHCRRYFLLLPILAGLTGCGIGNVESSIAKVITLTGAVSGGNQPVSGATIQLYTAGASGNGSAATAMITSSTVTTSSTGAFSIVGTFTCVHSTDQVYITATGGNPGLITGTNNDGIVMMTALGSCGNLATLPAIAINEVTTVAAVYALAPFMGSSYAKIGATSTNSAGIANAFLNAQLLASSSTGAAVTYSKTSGFAIEAAKLNALADAISYCVNSASSSSTPCAALAAAATPTGGAKPAANTLATALSIVQHPGDSNIVGAVWNLINSQEPFATTLTQAPNDWTMTLTVSNGGLSSPTSLAVDISGNVWIANYTGSLSAFSPQGTAFTSSPFGSGTLSESFGLTIDSTGNVWVSNFESPNGHGSVSKFSSSGSIISNSANNSFYFYDSSIDFPTALSADTNGNIGIANSANSSATIYSSSGTLVTSGLAAGHSSTPLAIAFDSSHGLWLANDGNGTVTHVSSSGTVLASPACCSGADGIAIDAKGNAWIANYSGDYVYAVSSTGSGVANTSGGGLSTNNAQPVGIAVDAAQNIWIATGNGSVITQLTDTGFPVSPSTGYGLDAKLTDAHGIAPDASGNIWVSDFARNTVVMFFGIAAPTVTPVQPTPTAP